MESTNGKVNTHEQAYSILLMNVAGAVVRGVSIMYATTVGSDDATASVMMAPEADQVKISICPGVSTRMWLRAPSVHTFSLWQTHSTSAARFSMNPSTWSNLVVNKFSAVRIPPLGPRLYLNSQLHDR